MGKSAVTEPAKTVTKAASKMVSKMASRVASRVTSRVTSRRGSNNGSPKQNSRKATNLLGNLLEGSSHSSSNTSINKVDILPDLPPPSIKLIRPSVESFAPDYTRGFFIPGLLSLYPVKTTYSGLFSATQLELSKSSL